MNNKNNFQKFERYEFKYILNKQNRDLIENEITHFMKIDKFANKDNKYFVRSLYFDDKDSTELAVWLTEDFSLTNRSGTLNKQETLDWTTSGGTQPKISDLEILFENDEVCVGKRTAQTNNGKSLQMFFSRKRGAQFCQWVMVRQPI